ncbi:hypothetical protein FHW36_10534 [Chitinophaga polysaccharea]|uniref:Uncharacterized protein n=1 Tax=Chitinophaga polysaccharea TaxID=1293035 RepID=A0A561PNA4_9BACT|nr:hypothetical protein [Chitinophaga polysaccharea]TWF39597.1 hypothetical protein FHW36_10534 [Chitinophaga polysaccharea]
MTISVATGRGDGAGLLYAGPPAKTERAAFGIPFREMVQAALPPVRGDGAGLLHAGPTRED